MSELARQQGELLEYRKYLEEQARHDRRNTQRSYVTLARWALTSADEDTRADLERMIREHAASGEHGDETEILRELGLAPR